MQGANEVPNEDLLGEKPLWFWPWYPAAVPPRLKWVSDETQPDMRGRRSTVCANTLIRTRLCASAGCWALCASVNREESGDACVEGD